MADQTIRPFSDHSLCWEIKGDCIDCHGFNVHLAKCDGKDHQKWKTDLPMEPILDGYCQQCSTHSLKSPNALQSNVNADLYGFQNRLSMQWDGNLVLYNGHYGYNAVWKNNGWTPRPTSFYRLTMQNDGNLVQYDSSGRWVWDTRTGGRPQGKYCLKVENNGNLKIFDSYCNAIWSRF